MSQYITGKTRRNILFFHYFGTIGVLLLLYFLHTNNLTNLYLEALFLLGLLGTINAILFFRNPYYIKGFRIYRSPFSSFTHTFIAFITFIIFWLPFGFSLIFIKPNSTIYKVDNKKIMIIKPTVIPSPTNIPEAISLTDLPEIYPSVSWEIKRGVVDGQTGLQGDRWTGKLVKNEGENELGTMFFDTIKNYYGNELLKLNWQFYSKVAADGPTGSITGLVGYKEDKMRVIKMSVDVSNFSNQCGTMCPCPCTYNYEIFISKVTKKNND